MDKSIYYYSNKFHNDFNKDPDSCLMRKSLLLNSLNMMFFISTYYNIYSVGYLTNEAGLSYWFWGIFTLEVYVLLIWSYTIYLRELRIKSKLREQFKNILATVEVGEKIKLIEIKKVWLKNELRIPETEYVAIAKFFDEAEKVREKISTLRIKVFKFLFRLIYHPDSNPRITTYLVWMFSAIVLILLNSSNIGTQDVFLMMDETEWKVWIGLSVLLFTAAVVSAVALGEIYNYIYPSIHSLLANKAHDEKLDKIKLMKFLDQIMIHAQPINKSVTIMNQFHHRLSEAGRVSKRAKGNEKDSFF